MLNLKYQANAGRINALPAAAFDFSNYSSDDISATVKLCLFFSFVLAFGGLFGAAWLFFAKYVVDTPTTAPGSSSSLTIWLGLSVFLQNILIFVG